MISAKVAQNRSGWGIGPGLDGRNVQFKRTISVAAPISEVWDLVDELEAVAACIPGVSDISITGEREFQCVMTQRVGAVSARFQLRTIIDEVVPTERVSAVSEGRDTKLGSEVRSKQRFDFRALSDTETEVDIVADYQISGRIATFGHRVLAAKAEQVTLEAVDRLSRLLEERRGPRPSTEEAIEG